MKTAEILDLAKTRLGISSDYALSKKLGVTTQAVSGWRSGARLPDSLTALRLGELVSNSPASVLADIERERAERAGRQDQASAWREWAEKLAGTAAAAVFSLGLTASPDAGAGTGKTSVSPGVSVYYVNRRRSSEKPVVRFARLLRAWLCADPLAC